MHGLRATHAQNKVRHMFNKETHIMDTCHKALIQGRKQGNGNGADEIIRLFGVFVPVPHLDSDNRSWIEQHKRKGLVPVRVRVRGQHVCCSAGPRLRHAMVSHHYLVTQLDSGIRIRPPQTTKIHSNEIFRANNVENETPNAELVNDGSWLWQKRCGAGVVYRKSARRGRQTLNRMPLGVTDFLLVLPLCRGFFRRGSSNYARTGKQVAVQVQAEETNEVKEHTCTFTPPVPEISSPSGSPSGATQAYTGQ